MDKIANAVETSPQFQSHKRVLREMGWDENRINKFLYDAMKHLIDSGNARHLFPANEYEGNVQ